MLRPEIRMHGTPLALNSPISIRDSMLCCNSAPGTNSTGLIEPRCCRTYAMENNQDRNVFSNLRRIRCPVQDHVSAIIHLQYLWIVLNIGGRAHNCKKQLQYWPAAPHGRDELPQVLHLLYNLPAIVPSERDERLWVDVAADFRHAWLVFKRRSP